MQMARKGEWVEKAYRRQREFGWLIVSPSRDDYPRPIAFGEKWHGSLVRRMGTLSHLAASLESSLPESARWFYRLVRRISGFPVFGKDLPPFNVRI